MEYKIHKYREANFTLYEDVIRNALNELGHVESDNPDLNIYNHCNEIELQTKNNIIFKPTAPSHKYFALDKIGYANASSLTWQEPNKAEFLDSSEPDAIDELIKNKSNKWDNSILLKWHNSKPKGVTKDHILVIGQMPDDETVTGQSFGNHIQKLDAILRELQGENVVVKLHPRYSLEQKYLQRWQEKWKFNIISGFYSIHNILPYTKVAIIENSTAGIECMMHNVPVISYGWPEYHWATYKLRSLTEINRLVNNINWYDEDYTQNFIKWYINYYLCHDVKTTMRRLKNLGY